MTEREKTIKIVISPLEDNESISLCSLTGYIDSYNAQYFQNTIIQHISQVNKNLIMDLSNLNYISSAGIGAFMAITKKLDDVNGNLVICRMGTKILEVFSLLGFTSFFTIVNSLEDAKFKLNKLLEKKEEVTIEKTIKEIIFPLIFECPKCRKRLKAPQAGRYRCSFCRSLITITDDGEVT